MNPEYASKSGYGTSASVELAKNNIQITERHRMKALRPSGRIVFENAKRVHESTVIKAPATYSRLGISSYMISPPLDSVADDSIYRQYGLIIRRRCFCVKRFWPLMADLTFRWNRKAMMLHGSGESSIPAHAKRGTIHGVAGSRDLRNAVLAARENGSS